LGEFPAGEATQGELQGELYQVSQQTNIAAVQADYEWLLSSRLSIHFCCQFYSATWPHCSCSTSYAEIPEEIVESEIRVADFRKLTLLCLMRSEQNCVEVCQNHAMVQAF